jgi:hypothetical protein
MSSWASAEWHSLVEHVGHRLKLILLRRLHLQRPTAIDAAPSDAATLSAPICEQL